MMMMMIKLMMFHRCCHSCLLHTAYKWDTTEGYHPPHPKKKCESNNHPNLTKTHLRQGHYYSTGPTRRNQTWSKTATCVPRGMPHKQPTPTTKTALIPHSRGWEVLGLPGRSSPCPARPSPAGGASSACCLVSRPSWTSPRQPGGREATKWRLLALWPLTGLRLERRLLDVNRRPSTG